MLGNHPVDVMLLATDLGVARGFYGDTLGLKVLLEDEQFLTFRCGATAAWWSPTAPPGRVMRQPRPPGGWTASPTSGSRWRPGSPIPTATGSACSSSSSHLR